MAIFVPGMKCAVSGVPIKSVDEAVPLPYFISNTRDPLFAFSDSVILKDVFETHSECRRVTYWIDAVTHSAFPENRICAICCRRIEDPENGFMTSLLTTVADNPLSSWNLKHFHRSCLRSWDRTSEFLDALKTAEKSGKFGGPAARYFITEIAKILRGEPFSL